MSANAWLALIRALVLMGLGTAGMIDELFIHPPPDMGWVTAFITMILGEGAWRAWRLDGSSLSTGQSSSQPSSSSSSSEEP